MKDWGKKARTWAWERLVFLADRISPEDAFRSTGYSMRLTRGKGWVFEEHDGKSGVKLWYKGSRDYNEHSHDCYDEEPVITESAISTGPGGIYISSDMSDEDVEQYVKNVLYWRLLG